MKQLDTDTVLAIIEMIDAKIWNIVYPNKAYRKDDTRIANLVELRDHLQEYIEGLVSQAENNLNAGE